MGRYEAETTPFKVVSASTARALRTAYQAAVGLIGFVPTLIACFALLPQDTPAYAEISVIMANVVVWTGVATKIINALEDSGVIPAPWKQLTQESASTAAPESENGNGI